jgi:hypothetical protein
VTALPRLPCFVATQCSIFEELTRDLIGMLGTSLQQVKHLPCLEFNDSKLFLCLREIFSAVAPGFLHLILYGASVSEVLNILFILKVV